jgi:hypothetical protein
MIRPRSFRITLVVAGVLAMLFAAYCVWIAVADYQMQVREHWKIRCGDAQIEAGLFACMSVAFAVVCRIKYKASYRW